MQIKFFEGDVRWARAWNRVLTREEIARAWFRARARLWLIREKTNGYVCIGLENECKVFSSM